MGKVIVKNLILNKVEEFEVELEKLTSFLEEVVFSKDMFQILRLENIELEDFNKWLDESFAWCGDDFYYSNEYYCPIFTNDYKSVVYMWDRGDLRFFKSAEDIERYYRNLEKLLKNEREIVKNSFLRRESDF